MKDLKVTLFFFKEGGGSSIVKVPRDIPPTRVYFFGLLVLPKGILFGNFSLVKRSRVCCLAILVKERLDFAIFCLETQTFSDFGLEQAKIWQSKSSKRQLMVKGAVFTILSQKLI